MAWLRQKGTSVELDEQTFSVSDERVKVVAKKVEEKLLLLNQGKGFGEYNRPASGFIKGESDFVAKDISSSFTQLLMDDLENSLNVHRLKTKSDQITDIEMVAIRSRIVSRKKSKRIHGVPGMVEFLQDNSCVDRTKLNYLSEYIVNQLVDAAMKELISGGEIFCFYPGLETGAHYLSLIQF